MVVAGGTHACRYLLVLIIIVVEVDVELLRLGVLFDVPTLMLRAPCKHKS